MMDFTHILDEHKIQYHTAPPKARKGWINFTCPHCHKDPYMGYRLSGRYVNCWNCGRHSLAETLQLLTQLPMHECYRLCKELPREESPASLVPRRDSKLEVPPGVGLLGYAHRKYLRERELLPSRVVQHWEVQGIGMEGGLLRWRLFIPVFYRGEMVSWTTRTIGDREPRYRAASPSQSLIPIDRLVYGIDHATNVVIVVEGPIDAWAIGYGAVALCGLRTSPAQLEQLSRFPQRVICFDAEPDAQRRARKLCNDLSVFDGGTVNVVLETGKDASRASKQEIESLRERFLPKAER